MGKKRSVVYGLGTTRSQHWGQWIGGTGRAQEWRQRPEAGQGRVRSKSACLPVGLLLLVLSLGLFSFLPDAAAGDDDGCLLAAINPIATPVHGNAFLCIDAKGVRVRLHAKGLEYGDAYTIWFFYWDDPSQCATPGQCAPGDGAPPGQCEGPLDLRGFNPLVVLGRLDSAVAPRNGKVNFAGRVRGLRLSSGSQVWLFIGAHGEAHASDNRARARQLLTPEDPPLGAPLLGNCVDGSKIVSAAIAIFNIP